ncbi:MAG: molybdenum cofactor guanylyltransferase [Candidatus Helarchaeota archaeon]
MELSIVVLAGGKAKRLGVDKALIVIKNRPLIVHTLARISSMSDDIIIVTKTVKRMNKLRQVIDGTARFFLDNTPSIESPLVGALTGFQKAKYKNILLIGCDMPLIQPKVIELLCKYIIKLQSRCWAVIPRHPNKYIEPLCAIYRRQPAIEALKRAISERGFKMSIFIDYISAVHFFPIEKIKIVDPDLQTFFNVNTREDLIKFMKILEDGESI